MKKQEIPKVVADVLKQVSEKVKDFTTETGIKLLAKSSDNFLLKIYKKLKVMMICFFRLPDLNLCVNLYTLNF